MKKQSYKAVCFFDLDGTLLNGQSQIDSEVVEAIATLKDNQVLPVIATGRSIREVRPIMEISGITSIISLNGQHIEIEGKTVYESIFSVSDMERFIAFTNQENRSVSFYNTYDFWAYRHTECMRKAYATIHSDMPEVFSTKHRDKEVHMILALSDDISRDKMYHEAFPDFTFFRNSPYSIDITQEGNDKSTGVQRILHTLQLTEITTYGFGDGANDVPLLSNVDYAVAMENGIEQVKQIADFVTTKNTEGGIVHALKHLGLL